VCSVEWFQLIFIIFVFENLNSLRVALSWSAGGRGTTLGTIIFKSRHMVTFLIWQVSAILDSRMGAVLGNLGCNRPSEHSLPTRARIQLVAGIKKTGIWQVGTVS
jgi:hypothetical protein